MPVNEIGITPPSDTLTPANGPKSISFYNQAIAKNLGPEVFKRNPYRLIWYTVCTVGSLALFLAIVNLPLSIPMKLLCGILIGICNGTMAFVNHEIAHGAVVKNPKLQDLLVYMGSIPFFISPTFWKFWHNRLHHGRTQQLIKDPDAFPNLRIYKSSKFTQFVFPFTPGSGHLRSYFYFLFWFSFHNFVAQTYLRFRNSIFDSLDQTRVTIEFLGQVIIGVGLLIYAGPSNWPWVFLIPLMLQNYIIMSYISTNHNLSPLTSENDPLLNSLTVTNHPILEFFNLNFGYHVEHHIFPQMSSKHAKAVHRELLKQFPDTYQVMPKWKAMKALYSTARIYKNAHTLINPETMETYPTIPVGDQVGHA